MLREATVVLQCILATVSEQEEAHDALVALLRLKDGDLCSRDAELEYLRQRLKERDAILQAVPTSGRLAVGGQGLAFAWGQGRPVAWALPRSRCIWGAQHGGTFAAGVW